MKTKLIAMFVTGTLMASTLGGCSSLVGKDAIEYPLVPQLSEKEVVDYYKEAMSFDTVASKNLDIQEVAYETKEVSADKKAELGVLVKRVESALGGTSYTYSNELNKVLKESTFHYIKSYLNDKKLSGGKVVKAAEALGYYFVDVEYEIGPRSIGNLTPQVSFLGLHGAFAQDFLGNDSINKIFITKSVGNMNRYYADNKLSKSVSFNAAVPSISSSGSQLPTLDFTQSTVVENVFGEANKPIEPVVKEAGTTSPDAGIEVATVAVAEASVQGKVNRAPQVNTGEFNSIAGSSTSQSSYMPKLGAVFQAPAAEGNISGIGIYPSGDAGLKRFGYSRTQIKGTMTLRYVFKSNVLNPSELLGINVYPVFSELVSGINANTENVNVPDFLMEEFNKLIERSDRAIVNTDLPALMSGKTYSDVGMAVLTGYESQYVNLLRHMSTIRRVVARDTKNSAYLIEVETIRQEGPKGVDTYGTFRDKTYVTVEQIGNEFIITDSICMIRKMTKEPSINPDSSVTKRLVALNLAGVIPDESKKSIEGLIANLYQASSLRVLNGPKEVEIEGKKTTLENGMYDCFNSDTSMLTTARKEYMNSTIRELLVKQGVNTAATYAGVITEWIGGASNQAEFTTEEVVTYKGKSTGRYMQVYYLVSNMNDKWVIDDMKIVEAEDKAGDELKQIVERINSK